MKILTNIEFLSNLTGFEVFENVQFSNSNASSLEDFAENSNEGTYFEEDETIYYKVRDTYDDCIVFDENENIL